MDRAWKTEKLFSTKGYIMTHDCSLMPDPKLEEPQHGTYLDLEIGGRALLTKDQLATADGFCGGSVTIRCRGTFGVPGDTPCAVIGGRLTTCRRCRRRFG